MQAHVAKNTIHATPHTRLLYRTYQDLYTGLGIQERINASVILTAWLA